MTLLIVGACYGNVACDPNAAETALGSCTPGPNVDPATGCCSNYAASGIKGKTTLLSLYVALVCICISYYIVFVTVFD